jgi:hypothetical protein
MLVCTWIYQHCAEEIKANKIFKKFAEAVVGDRGLWSFLGLDESGKSYKKEVFLDNFLIIREIRTMLSRRVSSCSRSVCDSS